MHPKEISKYLKLERMDISGYSMIKVVNFDETSKQICPKQMNRSDFLNWYIMPSTHQAYAYFWLSSSILNLASNLLVWFYI